MNECFKCGIFGEETRLFDVISKKGIVKSCARCCSEDNLPLIKRATSSQIKDAEKQESYKDRVGGFNGNSGIQNNFNSKENVSLRDLVDKNFKAKFKQEVKPRPDLIENFHWAIMRVRRTKHISRGQFAKDLGESETLIQMIEKGVLPENDNLIIKKIETYLNINLRKPEFKEETEKKEIGFDTVSVDNLTISDLKEMKEDREENIFLNPVEVWDGDIEDDSSSSTTLRTHDIGSSVNDKKFRVNREERGESKTQEEKGGELSQEDIDDLIFGK